MTGDNMTTTNEPLTKSETLNALDALLEAIAETTREALRKTGHAAPMAFFVESETPMMNGQASMMQILPQPVPWGSDFGVCWMFGHMVGLPPPDPDKPGNEGHIARSAEMIRAALGGSKGVARAYVRFLAAKQRALVVLRVEEAWALAHDVKEELQNIGDLSTHAERVEIFTVVLEARDGARRMLTQQILREVPLDEHTPVVGFGETHTTDAPTGALFGAFEPLPPAIASFQDRLGRALDALEGPKQ